MLCLSRVVGGQVAGGYAQREKEGSASSSHPRCPSPSSSRSSSIKLFICHSAFLSSSPDPNYLYTVQPPRPTQPITPSSYEKPRFPLFCLHHYYSHQLFIQLFDDDQHVRLALHPHARSPRLGCRSVHHYFPYQRDLLGEYSVGLVVGDGDQSADQNRLSSFFSLLLCSCLLLLVLLSSRSLTATMSSPGPEPHLRPSSPSCKFLAFLCRDPSGRDDCLVPKWM